MAVLALMASIKELMDSRLSPGTAALAAAVPAGTVGTVTAVAAAVPAATAAGTAATAPAVGVAATAAAAPAEAQAKQNGTATFTSSFRCRTNGCNGWDVPITFVL